MEKREILDRIRELENFIAEKKEIIRHAKACYEGNLYELLEYLFDNDLAEKVYQKMEDLHYSLGEAEDELEDLESELENLGRGRDEEAEREYWDTRI